MFMNSSNASGVTLSTLDRILAIADRADFAVILRLSSAPDIAALSSGAHSARTLYPVTGCVIDGKHWKRAETPLDGITAEPACARPLQQIEGFIDRPFDPRQQTPIQQLLAAADASS